jgi:hypothetical protein
MNSWYHISRREVIKLAIHDTLQLPPTAHRLSAVLGFTEQKMWHWDTQLFQSVTRGYVLVTATFSLDSTGPANGTLVHDLPAAIDQALVDGGFKGALGAPALNTVLHRLSVLSKAHQLRDVTNPTRDPAVQELVEHNPTADKPIVGPAAEALTAWLTASGVQSGAIFRRIRKTKACEPLAAQALWHIVTRRAELAGLEGDYGAHSLRSGFVSEAGRQNVPLGEAMALTVIAACKR